MADGDLKWRLYLPSEMFAWATHRGCASVDVDGNIYICVRATDLGTDVYKITPTGSVDWMVHLSLYNIVYGGPNPEVNDHLYFPRNNTDESPPSYFVSRSKSDGSFNWEYSANKLSYTYPLMDNQSYVMFYDSDNYLYRFDQDGNLEWCVKLDIDRYGYRGIALRTDGDIIVASRDNIRRVDSSGNVVWTYASGTGLYFYAGPTIATNGDIYIGNYWTMLYCIDENGNERWSVPSTYGTYSNAGISIDGHPLFSSYGANQIWKLDKDTGDNIWSYQVGDRIQTGIQTNVNGTIFFGCDDGYIYALNNDGTLKWRYAVGDKFDYTIPSIAQDGTLYIYCKDQYLYAIEESAAPLFTKKDYWDGIIGLSETFAINQSLEYYVPPVPPAEAVVTKYHRVGLNMRVG